MAGVLFGSFTMVGSQNINRALVGVNLVALSWLLSCHGLKFGRNSFMSFALVG